MRNGLVGFLEIERAGEIADRRAAPGAQIGHFGTEASLQESQHGSVIEEVGGHEAAATEGRDEQRGDAKTQSNRAGYRGTADYGGVRYGGRREAAAWGAM